MEKNLKKFAVVAAGLAGAGAAAALAKKAAEKKAPGAPAAGAESGYRNTELGRHEKNRKGIY